MAAEKVKKKAFTFASGLLGDTVTTLTVLVFVFVFTILLGTLVVILAIPVVRDLTLIGGVILSVVLVPLIVIFGIGNYFLIKHVFETHDNWFCNLFRTREVEPKELTREYKKRYILQKLTTFGISVVIYVISLLISSTLLLIPFICLILLPVAFPFVLLTITMPVIAWISLSYAFDLYHPEPRGFLVLALLWGMFSTFPSIYFNTFNITWMSEFQVGVISAPIFEELFKSLGFFLLYRQVKNGSDGLLYGVAFGGGFALLENFKYGTDILLAGGGGLLFLDIMLFRSFFCVALHMIGPALVGIVIGSHRGVFRDLLRGKTSKGAARFLSYPSMVVFGVLAYVVAVLNHSLWNLIAGIPMLVDEKFLIPAVLISRMLNGLYGLILITIMIGLIIGSFFVADRRYLKNRHWDAGSRSKKDNSAKE